MHAEYEDRSTIAESRKYFARLLGVNDANPTKQLGRGMVITRTGEGLYRITWANNPGQFVGWRASLGGATPAELGALNVVRNVYDAANKRLDFGLFKQYLAGNVLSSDPANIAANANGNVTLAVVGAAVGDTVMAHPRALADGLVVESYSVTAPDVVTASLRNNTAAGIDDVAQTWEYLLLKPIATDLIANQYLDIEIEFTEATQVQ